MTKMIRRLMILALIITTFQINHGFSYQVQARTDAETICLGTEIGQAGSFSPASENSQKETTASWATESSQDESNTQESVTAPENDGTLSFSIDAAHKYEGMEQPYQKGYKPTVTDKTVLIVLPLKPSSIYPGLTVRAHVDLGDPSDTPFEYTNLEKDFRLSEMEYFDKDNERMGSDSIFNIRYTLKLKKEYKKGIYPIKITVKAYDKKHGPVEQVFTIHVTIAKGTITHDDSIDPETDTNRGPDNAHDPADESDPDNAPNADIQHPDDTHDSPQQVPAETKPSSSPCILISDYKIAPERVTADQTAATGQTVAAGQTFIASVTLMNTSRKKSVQNMVLTIDCQDPSFTLKEPSDSIFLDTLGAGKTKVVTFKYQTDLETAEGHYKIHLSMTYDDSNAITYSSSGQITVNVKQETKVQLVAPMIESEYTAGDTIPLAFQVLNLGRNKIYNVRCEAEGYGMLPMNTAYIGDMEAGTEGNATLNLFITQKTKSPDYQGTEPYGLTEGTITLIYEDADGKEYSEAKPFTSSILAQIYSVTTDTEAPKGKTALAWWIAMLAGGLLLTAMLLGFFFYKTQKGKK